MAEQQTTPAPQAAPNAPTKVCKKCKASIPKYSEKCPNCGANLKPVFKKAWFWVLIVIVLILIFVGSCTASVSKSVSDNTNIINSSASTSASAGSSAQSSSSASAQAQKYTIVDEQLVDKGYNMYSITGTFTNTTNKEINYVQVEYVLKDASGAQVGTAYANTTNLAPNTPWKFEAMGTATTGTPTTFEMKGVTGY